MSVIRVNKTANYTVMSNYHFKDKRISLKAKGLLSQMLSLPEGWDYTIAGLVAINLENETAIKSALKELKAFGYLTVTKKMPDETKSGRIEYIYDIYEQPNQKQAVEEQGVENLSVEYQGVENHTQLSTKEENTDNKVLNIKDTVPYDEIIEYLNDRTGSSYRSSSRKTRDLIKTRVKEGFTKEDFFTVIDKKCADWLHDKQMAKFLRPETLFGTKFESYLNQPMREMTTKDLASNMNLSGFFDDIM